MKNFEVAYYRGSSASVSKTIVMAGSKVEAKAKFLMGHKDCRIISIYEK